MNKMLPSILALLLLASPASVKAQLSIATNADNTITITSYAGVGAVTIPANTNGLPVTVIGTNAFFFVTGLTSISVPGSITSIDDGAFADCFSLTNITIPGSVTNIGASAFYSCINLTGIVISNGVTSIGASAFSQCFSLTNVTIPGSVTNIGLNAFYECTNLAAITVVTNNPAYVSVNGVLFDQSQTTLVEYPEGIIGNYSIPNGVTVIGDDAFRRCYNLVGITIPNGVTVIGEDAFNGCYNLNTITVPNSVTVIGEDAFYQCFSLTNITIPGSVTNIGASAFYSCINLTGIVISNGVTSIGASAFSQCFSLTNVTIPGSVTNIGLNAFYECTNLAAITVVTNNPAYVSVNGVLFDQSQTTLVEYPEGIIGNYSIPNGVTVIGDDAFSGCTTLTGITIPDSVTIIGNDAFYQCYNLIGITIPDSVTAIGDDAFYQCSSLTNITIPNSIASIGTAVFYDCSGILGNIAIPGSVTNIGSFAFSGLPGLTTVTFQGNAPDADPTSFSGDNATFIYLPGTTGWGTTFVGLQTELWNAQIQSGNASLGIRTNQFGFKITGNTNLVVVVETTANLASPVWAPLATSTLTNGSSYFNDSQWTNFNTRYYRLRSP